VIEAALKRETSATTAQTDLMTTLGKQDKYNIKSFRFCTTKLLVLLFTEQRFRYSVLYAFDEHQVLFPKAGVDPNRVPVNALPEYFIPFTSWQGETAGVSSSLRFLPQATLLLLLLL